VIRLETKALFQSLKREAPLSDRVANQIQSLIGARQLKPGDSLPPERELAEVFNVSRTVVREAVKVLKAKGLVEVRRGSGVIVTAVSPEHVRESISLFLRMDEGNLEYHHLAELRRILEIEIAGLAALRACPEDLARMEREYRRMESMRDKISGDEAASEAFAQADVEFHIAIAAATGNPLLPILFSPLVDILISQRLKAIDRPGALEQGMLYHHDILEAIKRGDERGAREAMREHLEKSAIIMEMERDKLEDV
jgi:GntR family transcriptional repressor for pyruvate dehydrogenase complex